jgi:hypothetical protein
MGHILRRNCFLKYVIEEWIEVTGRRGRRRKRHWITLQKERILKVKEEALEKCDEMKTRKTERRLDFVIPSHVESIS